MESGLSQGRGRRSSPKTCLRQAKEAGRQGVEETRILPRQGTWLLRIPQRSVDSQTFSTNLAPPEEEEKPEEKQPEGINMMLIGALIGVGVIVVIAALVGFCEVALKILHAFNLLFVILAEFLFSHFHPSCPVPRRRGI